MNFTTKSVGVAMICGAAITANAALVTSVKIDGTTYSAPDGFGSFLSVQPNAPASYDDPAVTQSESLSFILTKGQTVHYDVAFYNKEVWDDAVDSARLNIIGPGGVSLQPWSITSSDVPWGPGVANAFSGWTPETFTASEEGIYSFVLSVVNDGADDKSNSYGFFAVEPGLAAVPEPSTWFSGAFLGGITLLGVVRNVHAKRKLQAC